MTETSPRRHRDKAETSPNTETSPKPDRDKTETSPRQDRDMTETSPRQDRDILGEFFSGAWAAPGRLIHVRPQAYRYWGKKFGKSENKIIQPGFLGIKKYIRCSWVLTINMNKGILPVKTTKSFCFRDPLKIEDSRLESQVNFKFSNSCPLASLMLLIFIHSVVVFPVRFGFACCFSCAVLHEQSLVVVCIFLGSFHWGCLGSPFLGMLDFNCFTPFPG